ncbi:tubulin polyglutamylase TTLL7 [Biomphalaria pfeifferi]|uniref:Tubulin polyglutamylase TTLL7 n=1 Tax=Biomphalaria pfeifferi TaxID=112525 RepID=A0AAD8BR72_BIOPF|nr:tubulin polyglutamylase TTLL7 [Biomphalaria pfeifferi]
MKSSTSLTSLSSMDKESSLNFYGHYGFNSTLSQQRSSFSNLSSAPTLNNNNKLQDDFRRKFTEEQDELPRLSNKKRQKRNDLITINLSGTRYEVVRQVVEKFGFTITKEDDPTSYLIWNDTFVSPDRISELKPYQHINHFPGMVEVTRKDSLARNMMKMSKVMPDDFNFVPKTWILPTDYTVLQNYAKDMKLKRKSKTFIVKPSNGAQGHGISLYKNAEKIPSAEHFVVQEYIDKPLLLDGYKFDLRIYVLITSCDPLRIFLFSDGLVRLATEKYLPPHETNVNHLFMHLTNYSVNKQSQFYDKNVGHDTGSKRSIRFFNEYLRRSDIDGGLLWRNISDMIVHTLLVAQPHVLHAYRMCRPGVPSGSDSVCFEILGFDIMIDRKLRPWLLEINRSPSFGTDEDLDFEIKSALLEDTIRLLNIKVSDKRRNMAAQKAQAQKRLFKSNKKVDMQDFTELDKKKMDSEKRKEELNELLQRIRRISTKEDFERRHCGQFRKIFPSDVPARQERYCNILTKTFSLFLAGRGATMQKEIQVTYNNKYKEEDILDMLAECEADEKELKLYPIGKSLRGPKPLQSMPESVPHQVDNDELYDSESSGPNTPLGRARSTSRSESHSDRNRHRSSSRPGSVNAPGTSSNSNAHRPLSHSPLASSKGHHVSRSMTRTNSTNKLATLHRSNLKENSLTKEKESELISKTLSALNEMRIKFPGKSDSEAELMLDQLILNWKFHKPGVASYWLVKLDSIKRRKIIDIVKSNVRAMLQRIYQTTDIEDLPVYRTFNRVFNRLLWSHGQGLWNCFSSSQQSWETIFSKSTENIAENEFNCCRRIVQLCKDCLLIVYKFADEARNQSTISVSQASPEALHQKLELRPLATSSTGFIEVRDLKPTLNYTPLGQKYTRPYQYPSFGTS